MSFERLLAFHKKLPAIDRPASIGCGTTPEGLWWIKLRLNLDHPLAWRHVQELGLVLNTLSVNEPLPTVFKPVSPPPYLNGGTKFLSWVIESTHPAFTPDLCAEWLEGRLPRPVDDLEQWEG